jgi:uncharacterized protein (DUF433 family)
VRFENLEEGATVDEFLEWFPGVTRTQVEAVWEGHTSPVSVRFFNVIAACTVFRSRYRWSMLDWSQCPAVERIAGKVSGTWLFQGTRVPVRALFENLEGGATVDEFLEWFPGVTRTQVEAVLEHAQRSLVEA